MPVASLMFVHYAMLILFVWVLLEQLGLPIPSIPVLVAAGTLSATHQVSATLALGVALVACLLADSLWYLLGRSYGHRVLQVLCRFSFEASTCVARTEDYFSRRGPVTLVIAKFVPGLSTVAAPIAGQTGMEFPRFLVWDLAGSILWAEVWIVAGRFFGDLVERSAPLFHMLSHFALALFVLGVVVMLGYRIWKQRRFLLEVQRLRLEPGELMQMMQQAVQNGEPAPYIVDLRHPLDYLPDPRVLPGAVRIGPAVLTEHHQKIPRDREVILYCTCPSEETSAKVAMQLHKLGIYRVRPLRGGFDGWKTAGYPLEEYQESQPE
ncbi:MAG: VTT domain-containing protein [Acidobacteriota bacterium]|nr:VTT domain-containing protein [Acidobacteriota bacterium]